MKLTARVVLWVGMLMTIGSLAQAIPLYWDGNGSTAGFSGAGQWDTATTANWNPSNDFSGTWGNWNQSGGQDIAVFSNTAGMVTISGGVSANQLKFAVDGYGITNGTLTMAGAGVFDVAPSATAAVYSILAGSVSLFKTNTGTLILAGTNIFSGTLTIQQGVVNFRTNAALGTTASTIVSNGAALQVQDAVNTAEPLTLNGAGIANDGALRSLSGVTNIFTGSTTLNSDARVNCDAGMLYLNGQVTLNNATLTVGGSGDTRIHKNFGSSSVLILGTGGLTKDGTGRLTVSADNNSCSYTGVTRVSEGTLQDGQTGVAGGNHLPTSTTLILGNGSTSGTFDLWVAQTIGRLATSGTGTSNTLTSTSGSTKALTLNSLFADTFSGQIAGTLSLTKNYAGTLTLSGSNTFSGGTTVGNGATLALDCTADNSSKLGTGTTTLQGAALNLTGNSSAPTAQNLNNVLLNTGHSTITVTSGGAQPAVLNLGSITRTAPGTVEFTLPANGAITTTTAVANGILGGYATIGTDWVTTNSTTLTSLVIYPPFLTSGTTTSNELLTGNGSLTGAKTLNSLKLSTSGAGQGLNLGTNNLVISSKGLLFAGADDYAINGTGSLGGSGNEMIIHAKGSGALTINAPISGGAGTFIKTGAGTVVLGTNNVYTGATTINQGVLRMGVASAIGALSPVTVTSGGTWDLNGNAQTVGALSGLGAISIGAASLTATSASTTAFSGQFQGSGGSFVKDGTGTLTFDGMVSNTLTGPISVVGGTLTLNRPGFTAIAGNLFIGDGIGTDTVNVSASHQIADTSRITINSLGTLTLAVSVTEVVGDLTIVGPPDPAFISLTVPATADLTIGALDMTGGRISLGRSTGADGILRLQSNVTAHASTVPAYIAMGGSGTFNVSNCGRLDLNGADRVFYVENGAADPDMKIGVRIQNLTGTAGWIKDGPGTLAFALEYSGSLAQGAPLCSYNGPTVIRDGKVVLVVANNLPTGTALTLGDVSNHSGVLDVNGFDQQVATLFSSGAGTGNLITNSALTNVTFTINSTTSSVYAGAFGDNVGGILSLLKSGAGTQELRGVSSHTGTNIVNAGVLTVNGDAALGQAPGAPTPNKIVLNAGTLAVPSNAVVSVHANRGVGIGLPTGATGATGTLIAFGNGALTINGVIASAGNTGANNLTKDGSGLVALTGANTYNGATTISAGALRLGGATALPGGIGVSGGASGLTLAGGVVELGVGDFTRGLGAVTNQVQITAPGGGFSAAGGDRAVNLGGATATVTWASGSFVPAGSRLILGSSFADSLIDFQNPINLNAALREVRVDDNPSSPTDRARISGPLSGTGASGISKTGNGVLDLTSTNTYAGTTFVSNGTLLVSGSLSSNAAVVNVDAGALGGTGTIYRVVNVASNAALAPGNPGSVGTLTIASNVTLAAGAVYNWDYSNGTGDRVIVGRTLTLPTNAVVNVTKLGGEFPTVGVLFTAGQLAGATNDLSGWTLLGLSDKYHVTVVGAQVLIKPPPLGTMFMVR